MSDPSPLPPGRPELLSLEGALLCDGSAPPREATVLLAGDHIAEILPAGSPAVPEGARRYDLGGHLLVPGLMDVHTHLFLSGETGPFGYERQLLKESLPFRTLRGAANARL